MITVAPLTPAGPEPEVLLEVTTRMLIDGTRSLLDVVKKIWPGVGM